jgi:hypothetical protein
MAVKFTPSINIIRDQNEEVNYFPTPNAKRVATQIASDFSKGLRSFSILGSYGTGKSAFMWAFAQSLLGKKHFFDIPGLDGRKVKVIPLVGEFRSVTEYFQREFVKGSADAVPEQIFAEIFQHYHDLGKKNGLLVLMIDEFGKFLEFAAKNNPEKELYFLQQLAEFINNPAHNIILLTAFHQNFDAYASNLNEGQRREWTKVKGRFREITFNEPVEQLLLLAGERLSQHPDTKAVKKDVREAMELFLQTKAFDLKPAFATDLALKLYPLELFSSSVAALAMQHYGQNERSLFSFLEGTGYMSLDAYDRKTNPFYNLANLYDYLIFNYYSFLSSQANRHFSTWSGIRNALERVENELAEDLIFDCLKIVKTVGLLHLFAAKGANLKEEFLLRYAEKGLGISHPEKALKALTEANILLYRNYQKRFILSEGTGVDLQEELLKADNQIEEVEDVVGLLNRYFSFPSVFAKQYYFKNGTPRIFEFTLSQTPKIDLQPVGDTDGYINLIFNETLSVERLKELSQEQKGKPILFGYYKNAAGIRDLLREIEKTKKTQENVPDDDKVAQNELSNIRQHQEALLNHYILNNLYSSKGEVVWIFEGKELTIKSKRDFNASLTKICEKVYHQAPAYRSELVNRSKLSSPIYLARRNFFKGLIQHWEKEDLGFEKDKFPPEKTIYFTLLRENGLVYNPSNPLEPPAIADGSTFQPLWQFGEVFLEKAKKHRYPLTEFTEALTQPPFKLKQGLIDFWLPTFLFLKRDEFALFHNSIYVPVFSEEVLELLTKRPQDFTVKAFEVEGIRLEIFNRYRQFLNQGTKEKLDNRAFIETIRPFLTFYKGLPEYAQKTKRLQKESLAIRDAIATATDPEKTFFEIFPNALGISLKQLKNSPETLADYINRLQNAIKEIRTCQEELVNRFEAFIIDEVLYEPLSFEAYKEKLRVRFKKVKQHLLLPHQKTLLMRLASELDDRKSWLSSIAQAVVGKTLEALRDEEEPLLFDKFKSIVSELDTLSQLSAADVEDAKEGVVSIEISTFGQVERKLLRYPKKKQSEIDRVEDALRTQLGKDKTLNIAALTNLLKELLK